MDGCGFSTPATAKLVAEPIANHVVNDKAATFREECESKLGADKLALVALACYILCSLLMLWIVCRYMVF